MNRLILDHETTIFDKGNPFARSNRCVCAGVLGGLFDVPHVLDISYSGLPCKHALQKLQHSIVHSDYVVAFNAKFDLHWSQRIGLTWEGKKLWDLQLAQFIIQNQTPALPSLNQTCTYYGLEQKIDIVKTEYWEKGIDTPQIPWDILVEYTKQDVVLEDQVLQCQLDYLKDKPALRKLIYLSCQDELVTQQMEWNGIKYAIDKSKQLGDALSERVRQIDEELLVMFPHNYINFNSDEHISALLYGGVVKHRERGLVEHEYRTRGKVLREQWVLVSTSFPKLADPLPKTALKKEGVFKTGEDTLRSLKATGIAKRLIGLLVERKSLETRISRYFYGFPKLYEKKDWGDELLHSNFSHCVAATGRLSSSKPNVQNPDEGVRECMITRF